MQKLSKSLTIISLLLVAIMLTACGAGQAVIEEAVDEAVAEALAEESQAEAATEAPPATLAPTETPEVTGEPETTEAEVEPKSDDIEMTEEELALLIDESVEEAVDAALAASEATDEVVADSTVTYDEIVYADEYVYAAELLIDEAEELIALYYAYYPDAAEILLTELDDLEEVLVEIAVDIEDIDDTLEEVEAIVDAGQELAEEHIEALQNAADQAQEKAETITGEAQAWSEAVQADIQARIEQYANLEPLEIANNREELTSQLLSYVETVKVVTADNFLSREEIGSIAQLNANIIAGLEGFDTLQTRAMAEQLQGITNQFVSGNLNQGTAALDDFSGSFGNNFNGLPEVPDIKPGSRRP